MNTELQEQHDQFKKIILNDYLPVLIEKTDDQILFLQKVKRLQLDIVREDFLPGNISASLKKMHIYKHALLDTVERHFKSQNTPNFDVDFVKFNLSANFYLETVDESRNLPEGKERYRKLSGDSLFLGIGKWWKRFFYNISKWPEKIANAFRKLFKRQVKELRPWHHQVKFRNLTEYYLKEKLSYELIPIFEQIFKTSIGATKVCWKIDEQLDKAFEHYLEKEDHSYTPDVVVVEPIDQEISRLKKLKEKLREDILEVYERVFEAYAASYDKVGTIEASNSRYNARKRSKQHKAVLQRYKSLIIGWSNTLLVLSDDWEIDLELFVIIFSALQDYQDTLKDFKARIEKVSRLKLEQIRQILVDVELKLRGEEDNAEFQKLLKVELENLRELLSPQLLPETNSLILAQDFPALVNNIEADVDRLIQSISTRRSVMKGAAYDQPVRTSALSFVSPYELINFESWPQFQKILKTVKLDVVEKINHMQNDVMDIGQIVEFNLESALSLFQQDPIENDPKEIAAEGIKRTLEKVEDISKELHSMMQVIEGELRQGLLSFNKSLITFTNNENIFDIRVRIARGKALEKSARFKEKLIHSVRNFIPMVAVQGRSLYREISNAVLRASKKFGIAGQQKVITTELADFLVETEKSIEQLPFVYQRLFRTEPLTDFNFFEGRISDLATLNHAYNNWTKGRFASTIIIGEKGSGVTTLVNYYLKDLSSSHKIYLLRVSNHICDLKDLLGFFSQEFEQHFDSVEALREFLNDGKKLIVLEHVQKLYLKKVNGFNVIKQLNELISTTNKSVFWLVTCTGYAWQYLDKTTGLSEHFSYVVHLSEFDDEAIVNMINKRHRVSGYNVQFEPAPSELNQKKFKKLKNTEQQIYLRDKYFSALNKIAKSNVKLALLYWLRSTKSINGNTIVIGSLKDIDFSFMNNLSANKVYVLANLLLHDGMSEEGYMEITGHSRGKAFGILQPMFEDGILTLHNAEYHVNPLLYRQTVMMLKMKNIIH